MHGSNQFYCVCCNKLEEMGEADVLFKTGYFRVIHPLGCCESCTQAAAGSGPDDLLYAELAAAEPGGDIYDPSQKLRDERFDSLLARLVSA
ncbi:hypothetical protein DNH61_13435 [Paenibacillus sambharensis]|uniref:Uncharacterized protein n=1 Tax=Paenibacillus sambharensis TaxID=1803190 RepID=A0A2W1LVJ6_9BACL|nr:hypothetical protein [Paenibacillus sambharensis]PZD95527.1 hypothetical protein DNH61_13435 [Paenibacillus sambharensis]